MVLKKDMLKWLEKPPTNKHIDKHFKIRFLSNKACIQCLFILQYD